MQEFLEEFYPEEVRKVRRTLFTLDISSLQNIISGKNWLKLQQEFETQQNPISKIFLIWPHPSNQEWVLTNFGNQETYYISSISETGETITNEAGVEIAHVSELPHLNNQLQDPQTICKLLLSDPQTGRQSPQGTLLGFIDLMSRLDLRKVNLERLKRPDLSQFEFDFTTVHQELEILHRFFREIQSSSTLLSEDTIQTVSQYLSEFYQITVKIKVFNLSGENPKEQHAELLQDISDFHRKVRSTLEPIIAYLRSTQINKFQDEFYKSQTEFTNFLHEATTKKETFDAESEAGQQKLKQLILEYENQLAEIPISNYQKVFKNQAEGHKGAAKGWFIGTICLVVLSVILYVWTAHDLGKHLGSTEIKWYVLVPPVFTKGFLISVFYMLLSRSIKNYTAEKHLEVVNRHRQNALATFEAFAKAAGENRDTRDQVLLASTSAIFDANQSGYLSGKASRQDSSNLIQQMFRSVIPDKNN